MSCSREKKCICFPTLCELKKSKIETYEVLFDNEHIKTIKNFLNDGFYINKCLERGCGNTYKECEFYINQNLIEVNDTYKKLEILINNR